MIAHNGSGFDSYVAVNNLPQWRRLVYLIENGAGITSIKFFSGYVDENKKAPQHVDFICGRVHINSRLKKVGVRYKLQSSLLKQEMEHCEIYEDTREARDNELLLYVKKGVLSTAFCYSRYIKALVMEELTIFSMKNSLDLPSSANK